MSNVVALLALLAVTGTAQDMTAVKSKTRVVQRISVSPEGKLDVQKPLARRKDGGESSGVSAVLPNAMITEADESASMVEVEAYDQLAANATGGPIHSGVRSWEEGEGHGFDKCMDNANRRVEGAAKRADFIRGCNFMKAGIPEDQCNAECSRHYGNDENCCKCNSQCHQCPCSYCRGYCMNFRSTPAPTPVPTPPPSISTNVGVCNAMCTSEFVDNCVPWQLEHNGTTTAEAYDICRYQMDYPQKAKNEGQQHNWLKQQFEPCKRCTDSPEMAALNPGTSKYDLTPGATCQPGYQPITSSWQECRDAAMALGFTGDAVAHVDYTWDYNAEDRSHPQGCFQAWNNHRFHFDGKPGGPVDGAIVHASILCVRAYYLTPGATCQPGYQPITSSWQDCRDAAMALGFTGDAVAHVDFKWDYATKSHPEGCFQAWDHDRFHFNLGAGGAFQNGDNILCIKAAS